jgi:hypothetical protein
MNAFNRNLGIVVTGLLLTAGPALAQKPSEGGSAGAADRGAGSGGSAAGGGMNAGSGGGNVASSGGGGVSSGGSSSSSGGGGGFGGFSPSASAVSSPSVSMGDRGMRQTAPEHRLSYSATAAAAGQSGEQKASPRPASGDSGERAVARGAAATAAREGAREGAGVSRRMNDATPVNNASGAREVPNWSRPRGDNPVTDTAVTRTTPRPDPNRGGGYRDGGYGYYDPYYYGGIGYGLSYYNGYYGYPLYAPMGWGYGMPYGFYDPFYGDPYEYGAGYGAYSSKVYSGREQGSLKLKVKPHNAKVYVDGYFVGNVDQFDGAFQKLTLNGGRHKVELRAEGYETTEFDVLVTPNQTITFSGDMKKSQ